MTPIEYLDCGGDPGGRRLVNILGNGDEDLDHSFSINSSIDATWSCAFNGTPERLPTGLPAFRPGMVSGFLLFGGFFFPDEASAGSVISPPSSSILTFPKGK